MSDHDNPDHSIEDSTASDYISDEDEDVDLEVLPTDEMRSSLTELASRLCSICREFPRGDIEKDVPRVYHPSLSSLKNSVDAGCRVCQDLSQLLDKFCKQLQPSAVPTESFSIQCAMKANSFWRRPGDLKGSYKAFELCFSLQESDNPCAVKNYHEVSRFAGMIFYPVNGVRLGLEFLDPDLEESTAKWAKSMDLARHWYQQCLSHSTCRNWRQESRKVPTRLVRIWRPDNNCPDTIFAELCEEGNLPPDVVYTTLSHRWGDNPIFRLRQDNIEKLRQSITFNQLPQVYQDAIYVSIELGINYIWLDSLCIIQDSKEDWTYEAKRMGDVYQYAACNIAAAGYNDNGQSMLGERRALSKMHPPAFADCSIETPSEETDRFNGLYIRADHDAFGQEVVGSILNSRAWVAQERALSPGILHFTPEMMWWECNGLVANEVFPTGHVLQGHWDFQTCTIRSLSEESHPGYIYAFWRKFIGLYAGKKLTYEQDRFAAAVGIARKVNELIDDNLIAGFWQGDLIWSLIMERDGRIEDIPATPRAPSWSWASLRTGYISYPLCDPDLVQPLGGVSIRVLSDLPAFKSDLDSASVESSDVRGLEITAPLREFQADMEVGMEDSNDWVGSRWIRYDISRSSETSSVNVPENEAWRLRDPTHLLFLARYKFKIPGPGSEDGLESEGGLFISVWALLVQQGLTVEGPNTFRKLGVAEFRFRSEEKLEEYLGLLKDDEGEYISSPVSGQCGYQQIVLI